MGPRLRGDDEQGEVPHANFRNEVLAVFGAFNAFGFLGLFIGPTLIAIMFTLLQAWRAAVSGHPAREMMKSAV